MVAVSWNEDTHAVAMGSCAAIMQVFFFLDSINKHPHMLTIHQDSAEMCEQVL